MCVNSLKISLFFLHVDAFKLYKWFCALYSFFSTLDFYDLPTLLNLNQMFYFYLLHYIFRGHSPLRLFICFPLNGCQFSPTLYCLKGAAMNILVSDPCWTCVRISLKFELKNGLPNHSTAGLSFTRYYHHALQLHLSSVLSHSPFVMYLFYLPIIHSGKDVSNSRSYRKKWVKILRLCFHKNSLRYFYFC